MYSLIFVGLFTSLNADFVCHNIDDSNLPNQDKQWRETVADKIEALEEQVQQLQNIVASGTLSGAWRRVPSIPSDCRELYANGTRQDGVYLISPDGRCPFKVYCDMINGGWTVIQKRIDGTVNFYRKWDEYVEGFGEINGEHWLGLEKIHRLTKDGNQIYFDIGNYDGTTDYAHYKSFAVDGMSSLYTLHVDAYGYQGSIYKELFSYHNEQKFSTFDRDNDAHATLNCALDVDGVAWWYKNCYHFGNFNGVFGKKTRGGLGYAGDGYFFNRNVTIKTKHVDGFCEKSVSLFS